MIFFFFFFKESLTLKTEQFGFEAVTTASGCDHVFNPVSISGP